MSCDVPKPGSPKLYQPTSDALTDTIIGFQSRVRETWLGVSGYLPNPPPLAFLLTRPDLAAVADFVDISEPLMALERW